MNNIDVSIINVLKATYPDIFNQYFNNFGIIPNPNMDTRNKAKAIFRNYSSENFENFMERYRNLVWKPQKNNVKKKIDLSACQVLKIPKEKFEILKFIIQKIKNEEYNALEFQSDYGIQEVLTDLDYKQSTSEVLKVIHDYIKTLNKMNEYEILHI